MLLVVLGRVEEFLLVVVREALGNGDSAPGRGPLGRCDAEEGVVQQGRDLVGMAVGVDEVREGGVVHADVVLMVVPPAGL